MSATSKSKTCYSKNYLTGNTYMAMVVLIKALYIPKHVSLLLRLPVGHGGVKNSPRSVFLGFFRCSKLGYLGYRSWVIPLCILLSEPVSPRLFNSIPSKLCHQNTHFNMYTTTSKQQEGSTCKDSYQNCFIATQIPPRNFGEE